MVEVRSARQLQAKSNSTEEGDLVDQSKDAFAMFGSVSRLVCGRNISGSPFTSGGQANRFDNLRDQIKEKEEEEDKYKYDNSTSQECNELIKEMEQDRAIRFLWSQLKPFFRGKILYTPDTPATRSPLPLSQSSPFLDRPLLYRRLVSSVAGSYFAPLERAQAALAAWEDTWADRVGEVLLSR